MPAINGKKLVLIGGDSGHGKSTLARMLGDTYGYRLISLDRLYVDFISAKFPELYFPFLRFFIAQHFGAIVQRGVLENEVVQYWREHVCSVIGASLGQNNLVAVEGYLLNALTEHDYALLEKKASVIKVEVKEHGYTVDGEKMTVEDIAKN